MLSAALVGGSLGMARPAASGQRVSRRRRGSPVCHAGVRPGAPRHVSTRGPASAASGGTDPRFRSRSAGRGTAADRGLAGRHSAPGTGPGPARPNAAALAGLRTEADRTPCRTRPRRGLFDKVCRLRRQIALANPLLNFTRHPVHQAAAELLQSHVRSVLWHRAASGRGLFVLAMPSAAGEAARRPGRLGGGQRPLARPATQRAGPGEAGT